MTDRWVTHTHKHTQFKALVCNLQYTSLCLCWNLFVIQALVLHFPCGPQMPLGDKTGPFEAWTEAWKKLQKKQLTSKYTRWLEKTHKPQIRLRITSVFHVPTSLRKTIHLLELHLCAFLGTTHDDVRGTVETAKPVLRIWAQKLQSSHTSLQQRYCLWSVIVNVHFYLLRQLLTFGVINDVGRTKCILKHTVCMISVITVVVMTL